MTFSHSQSSLFHISSSWRRKLPLVNGRYESSPLLLRYLVCTVALAVFKTICTKFENYRLKDVDGLDVVALYL